MSGAVCRRLATTRSNNTAAIISSPASKCVGFMLFYSGWPPALSSDGVTGHARRRCIPGPGATQYVDSNDYLGTLTGYSVLCEVLVPDSALQEIVCCIGQPVAGNPTQFMMQRVLATPGSIGVI